MELRLPNFTAQNELELLNQIRSYLYQLVPQLEWAFNNLDTSSVSEPSNIAKVSGGVQTEGGIEICRFKVAKGNDIYELSCTPLGMTYSKNGTILWTK